MRILADENITAVREHFAAYGEVVTVPGRSIDAAQLRDCDALLVRSVTKVTPALFAQSRCRFVASATSGTDHLDIEALEDAGINVVWAAGCNSISVVDYVCSTLAALTPIAGQHWSRCSVGVIGCGLIGGALARRLLLLGMPVKIFDPLLSSSHPLAAHFCTLTEVLQQQVISLHVPLTRTEGSPTWHMLAKTQLQLIAPDAVLINAARGAAIDNSDLLDWLQQRPTQRVVLDTWEREPAIALDLLRRITLGTPHIAGYSSEGKLNGTGMIHQQFCRHFGFAGDEVGKHKEQGAALRVSDNATAEAQLDQLILSAYDVRGDHRDMQGLLQSPSAAADFDRLRKHYPARHEFSHYRIVSDGLQPQAARAASLLGFQL